MKQRYETDAIEVGRCNSYDTIASCSSEHSHYENTEDCKSGSPVKITITCSGHSPLLEKDSCTGKQCLILQAVSLVFFMMVKCFKNWITILIFFDAELTIVQLVKKKHFCAETAILKMQSGKQNMTLQQCAKIVSLSKGKNECHATSGIFMHQGYGSGVCSCSKDDCIKDSSSTTGINIYRLAEGERCILHYLLIFKR